MTEQCELSIRPCKASRMVRMHYLDNSAHAPDNIEHMFKWGTLSHTFQAQGNKLVGLNIGRVYTYVTIKS